MTRPRHWSAEVALAGVALVALGFLVLTPHVQHGGFYADDWGNAAAEHFEGWWRTSVYEWRHSIPQRPILALLHPLPYALFGLDPTYHLAASVVLAALTSFSFFVLLRVLGIELRHALAMAMLSLVFPWSDATRLWPTGAMNNVAVIAYFLGSAAAVRGFAHWHARHKAAVLLHLLAAVLYLVSILTYEVALAAIFFSGLLYRTRVTWRALRARWALDALLVLVTLAISLHLMSGVRHVGSLKQRVADLPHFVGQALSLFASIFVPRDLSSSWTSSWDVTSSPAGKLVVLGAAAAVVAVAFARSRRPEGHELRRWLYRSAWGAGGVAVAYVMFLGSGLFPLFYPGIDDRIQTLAAFGFVVAAYSVLALAALLVAGGRGRVAPMIIIGVGTTLIGLGLIQRVRADLRHYDAAAVEQRHLLERLQRVLPHPLAGSTIFTFGYPGKSAPGVPIFQAPEDLRAAVDLRFNERSLRAVPIYEQGVDCGPSEVSTLAFPAKSPTAYGHAVFVDLASGRTRHIGSARACVRARKVFRPGPVYAAGAVTHDSRVPPRRP
jgi:MFS family permease